MLLFLSNTKLVGFAIGKEITMQYKLKKFIDIMYHVPQILIAYIELKI